MLEMIDMKKILFILLIFSLLILSSCTSPQKTECSQDTYDCNEFKTHQEAQKLYELCGGVENDIHYLDGNKDGEACESLPSISSINIIFIVSFVLILIIAFLLFRKSKKKDKKDYNDKPKENSFFDNNIDKGDKFVKYIISLLPKNKWSIKHCSVHIKGINRKIETYSDPDLVIRNIKTNKCFAIECKYRSNFKYSKYFKEKGLTVRKEHLDSYKEFRKNTNYPVYVIFGFRGYADNPDSMFLIPLDKVEMFMNEKYLKNYSFALDKDFIDLNNILK